MPRYYEDVAALQRLAWKGDDQIGQDDLFELQDALAAFALKVANAEQRTPELLREFPFLYTTKEGTP